MIKKENGITLVLLIITLGVMLIISSTVVYISLDRFEINNLRMLKSDLELLRDSVSNYYLKYGGLPLLRSGNTPVKYTYTTLNFEENGNYYILDLGAIGNMSLNYGKEGFENPNTSNDVYVINDKTHTIYYVKGIELDGTIYHYLDVNGNYMDSSGENIGDFIPPTKPQIRVISGLKNDEGIYITEVKVEIIPGIDSLSNANTSYTIYYPNSVTISDSGDITEPYVTTLSNDGEYNIEAKTSDSSGNESSTATLKVVIEKEEGEHTHTFDDGITIKEPTCTEEGTTQYTCITCGQTYTEAISALEHSYSGAITTAATCTQTGVKTYTCSRCGDSYKEVIPISDHSYNEEIIDTSLCVSYKVKYTCANCGDTYTEIVSTGKNHTWLRNTGTPLCDHKHLESYYCTNDGCEATAEAEGGHVPAGSLIYEGYFICICGTTVDFPRGTTKTDWEKYSTYYPSFQYSSSMEASWAAWNDIWSSICAKECNGATNTISY